MSFYKLNKYLSKSRSLKMSRFKLWEKLPSFSKRGSLHRPISDYSNTKRNWAKNLYYRMDQVFYRVVRVVSKNLVYAISFSSSSSLRFSEIQWDQSINLSLSCRQLHCHSRKACRKEVSKIKRAKRKIKRSHWGHRTTPNESKVVSFQLGKSKVNLVKIFK